MITTGLIAAALSSVLSFSIAGFRGLERPWFFAIAGAVFPVIAPIVAAFFVEKGHQLSYLEEDYQREQLQKISAAQGVGMPKSLPFRGY